MCLIQIAVPSRTDVPEYARLKQEVEELASSINSRFGGIGSNPVHYLYVCDASVARHSHHRFTSVDSVELTSLYHIGACSHNCRRGSPRSDVIAADAALITSIRDGMNLVSLEYVACQRERHGVLILSEFAGSAGVLNGALRVNPWSSHDVANAIHDALTMPVDERMSRHEKLRRWVEKHTASYWGTSFVEELKSAARNARQPSRIPSLWRSKFPAQFKEAKQRLIVITYDGTLVPFMALPGASDSRMRVSERLTSPHVELARPSRDLLALMARLTADPRNIVFVHSGRSSAVLEQWFAGADRLGLSAEDGYYIRSPGVKEWSPLDAKLDLGWREVLKPVFEYFAERTPGSFIEEKELALTWHYRNADVDFGARCRGVALRRH